MNHFSFGAQVGVKVSVDHWLAKIQRSSAGIRGVSC